MKLTIGILISNRIDTVKKCLDSVKPLIDKGIAELICVDTVSGTPGLTSDGSAELAKKYTDKVYVFPWINDFSAARNVTLENATGDWYMFCDDDEWFDDVSEIVHFSSPDEYLKYNSASYLIRNYKNRFGSEWTDTKIVRFTKRTKDLKFVGRVHESYSGIQLPCKEFSCFAHHYGYAFESEEEKNKHRQRNLSLLEEELLRRPEDLRLHAQMAMELANYDNEKALRFIEETQEKFQCQKEEPYYQWMVALKFPLFEALSYDPQKAEEEYTKEKNKLNETAQLAINYGLTRLWLLNNNKSEAAEHINEYFRLLKIIKSDDNMRLLQNTADFAKYMSDEISGDMEKYKEFCMDNGEIKVEDGLLFFGKTNYELVGTIEEKIKQLDEMSFDDFKLTINALISTTPSCFEDEFLNSAVDYFAAKSQIEYCFLLYRMSEEEIKRAVDKGATGEAIFELFNECICTERRMYELLYKPFVFTEEGIRWMSSEIKYNKYLYEFISGGCKDIKVTLEAAKIRPDMAKVIKVWLGALK